MPFATDVRPREVKILMTGKLHTPLDEAAAGSPVSGSVGMSFGLLGFSNWMM